MSNKLVLGSIEAEQYNLITSLYRFLYVCMVNTIYLLSFVETPRKFIIAELSIRKLGSSSVRRRSDLHHLFY